LPDGVQLDASLLCGHYAVRCQYIDARDIPWDHDAVNIFVIQGIQYIGEQVWTPFVPVAFEDYARNLQRKQMKAPSDGRSERLSRSVKDALLLEFPWLSADDFEAAASRCEKKLGFDSGPRAPREHGPADDDGDDGVPDPPAAVGVEAVVDELRELREEWLADDDSFGTHWYVRILGGVWTMAHVGLVADSVGSFARAHTKDFRKRYGAPGQKTFSFAEHTQDGAHQLSREWSRKCEHYFKVFLTHDAIGVIDFTLDEHAYTDTTDFLDWATDVPVESDTFDRVIELRNFVPVHRV
jgi:hypothetical protein